MINYFLYLSKRKKYLGWIIAGSELGVDLRAERETVSGNACNLVFREPGMVKLIHPHSLLLFLS